MRWTRDWRRETEWEQWFAWHAVPTETIYTGKKHWITKSAQGKLTMVRWEYIERRKIALPNGEWTYIYRPIESDWEPKKLGLLPRRPALPPSRVIKEGSLPPESR